MPLYMTLLITLFSVLTVGALVNVWCALLALPDDKTYTYIRHEHNLATAIKHRNFMILADVIFIFAIYLS